MKTVGTLKELNVKPGDVVEWDAKRYEVMPNWSVNPKGHSALWAQRVDAYGWIGNSTVVTIISRATDTPTLWRDMAPEEKGALLLAHHEGKEIECWRVTNEWFALSDPDFSDDCAYRIKPEPKVEVVKRSLHGQKFIGYVAINMVDGEYDMNTMRPWDESIHQEFE